jgi:predicted amidophosphoribosyltransferase
MNCHVCAEPNSKTALYCENCGEPLTVAAASVRRERERREKQTSVVSNK